jgi:hypothetical protein
LSVSIELHSALGFSAVLPDGSFLLADSSGGPQSEQISIPGDILFSMVRDDDTVHDYAQTIEWTEKFASFYTFTYHGVIQMAGSIASEGKQSYAVAVDFTDQNGNQRIATVVGMKFGTGEFFGLTLLDPVTEPGQQPDAQWVKQIVDGISVNAAAA